MPEQHIDNEKIPTRLIGAIVAVGSLAFIGILTETVMTVLFPALMREFHVDTATGLPRFICWRWPLPCPSARF